MLQCWRESQKILLIRMLKKIYILSKLYFFIVLVVVVVIYCNKYIILLFCLYHFIVLNAKIKTVILGVV